MHLADSNKALHGLFSFFQVADVAFANSLTDQFGDGGRLALRAGVEGAPEVLVKIELRTLHNVFMHCDWARTVLRRSATARACDCRQRWLMQPRIKLPPQ